MNLRDGTKKMSKSDESDMTRINLTDDADAIAKKIRKAKTDPEPLPSEVKGLESRPEADTLVGIYAGLAGNETVHDMLDGVAAAVVGLTFATGLHSIAQGAQGLLAPAITAPLGSVTVPTMLPKPCA